MSISALGTLSTLNIEWLARARSELTDLQRQLGTGRKAQTYGGLGQDRGVAVGLRSRLSATAAFQDTLTTLKTRIELMQTGMSRLSAISHETKADLVPGTNAFVADGQTAAQRWNKYRLDEMVDVLNGRDGTRYLFGGKDGASAPVAPADQILDGDPPGRAGLRQIVDERRQADLGTGSGRLTTAVAAADVSVAEDGAHPFGFKLASAQIKSGGTTTTATPAGAPPALTLSVPAGNLAAGDSVTLRLSLPDGTTSDVTLTATTASPPQAGQFTIGANAAATAANLKGALDGALASAAKTTLVPASAMAAGRDFFATGTPQRVDGPPFASATALRDGSADTVLWYRGEDGTTPDRATMTAKIDTTVTVDYGVRANEEAIRWQVQHVALFSAVSFDATATTSQAAYETLAQKLSVAFGMPDGVNTVEAIQAELGGVQSAMNAAKDHHTASVGVLEDLLASIEQADTQEVGAQLLQAQTRLQASLQTTALLSKISLVNYL